MSAFNELSARQPEEAKKKNKINEWEEYRFSHSSVFIFGFFAQQNINMAETCTTLKIKKNLDLATNKKNPPNAIL